MALKSTSDPQNLVKHPGLQNDSPTRKNAESIHYNLDVTPDSQWVLVHSSQKAQTTLLHVQETGEFIAQADYFTKRRSVNSYLLKIVLDGEGVLDYDGKRYHCHAGNFFWIDCRKPHYYATARGSEHWHLVWMHFWGGSAKSYHDSFIEANHGAPVGYLQAPLKTAQLIRDIISRYCETRNDYCTDVRTSATVTNVLAECLAETIQNTTSQSKPLPPERIHKVYDYISLHFTEKLTLDTLSSLFFMNKFYLQKQFQHYIGKSPCEYQNELRIDSAKELLRMTRLSVNDISVRLGFESTSYFIHLFKKREGVTPLQYRNNWI